MKQKFSRCVAGVPSAASDAVGYVLLLIAEVEVRWVDAQHVVAVMENTLAFRNLAVSQFPGSAMGSRVTVLLPAGSVASVMLCPGPKPASLALFDLGPELADDVGWVMCPFSVTLQHVLSDRPAALWAWG